MNVAEVHQLPTGRALFSDTDGRVLRATWHLERGLVNLSVWNDDRCTETFRLSLGDAAQFVAFLVEGLSDATARLLHVVNSPAPVGPSERRVAVTQRWRTGRRRLATWIAPAD